MNKKEKREFITKNCIELLVKGKYKKQQKSKRRLRQMLIHVYNNPAKLFCIEISLSSASYNNSQPIFSIFPSFTLALSLVLRLGFYTILSYGFSYLCLVISFEALAFG